MPIKPCKLDIDGYNREKDNRGSQLFPCVRYETLVGQHRTEQVPWHWHCEVEVLVVHRGAITLRFLNDSHILYKGEGAFINSEALHSITAADAAVCEIHSLVFHANLISGIGESAIEQRYVRPLLQSGKRGLFFAGNEPWHGEAIQHIVDAFEGCRDELFGYELSVRESLSRLWRLIAINHRVLLTDKAPVQPTDALRFKIMLDYIHTHYAARTQLSDIARAAAISERECLRCFKRMMGTTPMKYLQSHRLAVASGLLVTTQLNVTEISKQVGFDSPSYFSSQFKQIMETTPTAYRRLRPRMDGT